MDTHKVPQPDADLAHAYRLTQAARLIRFCAANGLDPKTVTSEQLAPIHGPDGTIRREPADFQANVRRRINERARCAWCAQEILIDSNGHWRTEGNGTGYICPPRPAGQKAHEPVTNGS